jgi:hypothetical protein
VLQPEVAVPSCAKAGLQERVKDLVRTQLRRLQLGQLGQQRLSSNSRVVLSAQTRLLPFSLQDSQHALEHSLE